MIVNVTQKHIDSGILGCSNCVIALAIKDAAHTNDVTVGYTCAYIKWTRYNLPSNVTNFIRNFEERIGKLEPFSFELVNGEQTNVAIS